IHHEVLKPMLWTVRSFSVLLGTSDALDLWNGKNYKTRCPLDGAIRLSDPPLRRTRRDGHMQRGADLQVCMSKSSTCCTKKMEEKYQVAARRDVQNLLQTYSSRLKLLLSRYVAAFQADNCYMRAEVGGQEIQNSLSDSAPGQLRVLAPIYYLTAHDRHMIRIQPWISKILETFEVLMRQAENHTNVVLQVSYQKIADPAAGSVRELFTDVGLFLLGSELNVDEFVQRFFDALFPLVYNHYISPGVGDTSPGYTECVRSLNRVIKPFGTVPDLFADQIATSGVSGKLLLQALHLGIEVINTTDHLQPSRECRRALLKMQYCPHCQGITHSKPCMGYCLNVMRGCLASMAEIDAHWREFVRSLEGLSTRMHGAQDLEQVLLGAHTMLHDAIGHAQKNGPRLSAQVQKLCSTSIRRPAQSVSIQDSRVSIPLKALNRRSDDSLSVMRKDFLKTLRTFSTFYGGLADQMCLQGLSSGDGVPCWNGTNIVK
ncbi:hypothetical protein CCH79_00005010, partial [Gambusia affinis]